MYGNSDGSDYNPFSSSIHSLDYLVKLFQSAKADDLAPSWHMVKNFQCPFSILMVNDNSVTISSNIIFEIDTNYINNTNQ